jgi:hypothetical protein
MRFLCFCLEAENWSLLKVNEDLSIEANAEKSIEVELSRGLFINNAFYRLYNILNIWQGQFF